MIREFTAENVSFIEKVLHASPTQPSDDVFRFQVQNAAENRRLALELQLNLQAHNQRMNVVSVYAQNTFLQLHNCTGFVASEALQQVTFFGNEGGRTSGLIVEATAGCSLYANVEETILNSDFTALPEDLMMCAIALSLTESMGDEPLSFTDDA